MRYYQAMTVRARIFCGPSFELINQMFDIHKIMYAAQDNGGLQIFFQIPTIGNNTTDEQTCDATQCRLASLSTAIDNREK
jgi:hypothetical protein